MPASAFVALTLVALCAVADEEVQKATGAVTPPSSVEEKKEKSAARKDEAEWIRRCDKLQGEARMQCLEAVRMRMVERLEAAEPSARR